MDKGVFSVPKPHNEPVKSYAPGSPERAAVLAAYTQMYQESIEAYKETPDEATKMLGGFAKQHPTETHQQLAALVIVANVILNLDEFLTH